MESLCSRAMATSSVPRDSPSRARNTTAYGMHLQNGTWIQSLSRSWNMVRQSHHFPVDVRWRESDGRGAEAMYQSTVHYAGSACVTYTYSHRSTMDHFSRSWRRGTVHSASIILPRWLVHSTTHHASFRFHAQPHDPLRCSTGPLACSDGALLHRRSLLHCSSSSRRSVYD
ncbi:uncharacterized protein LAESUDRAFT_150200 [Laetiporus sulphureus 93-53]|uniref:Uncharacterized protein n=1 Tax=Laetiporus sulphureus 93-53 TaxID=1314785 RepID=A0A165ECH0_9APHY|nr:uncharacterized protein LAESUDRAFT_150200 [Laetiporus sulphureus 93-53]KZT06728.1 hypothetical protein LAESUDRAFT_150200 [Laetiporus sulphureus 93-53]